MPKFIAERSDRTFTDAHGVTVHYYVWEAAKPRAVLQLAHGLGEYARRYELLAQAFVAAGVMVVRADIFVTRMPDQDRSRDQLVALAADAVGEAAPAHVGNRVAVVSLHERRVVRPRAAPATSTRYTPRTTRACASTATSTSR